MAKVKSTIIKISGKLDNKVFVDSKVNGQHVRDPVKKGSKKDEVALKTNYSRTRLLNRLASELNIVMESYGGNFKSTRFYNNVQSLFRAEEYNNRFLLLSKLKGLEINTDYPSTQQGQCKTTVSIRGNKFLVNLQVTSHPPKGEHSANTYYYEVILLTWVKKKKASHSSQLSEWIPINQGRSADNSNPEFDFLFPKPAGTQHWLLCLRQRLGVNEEEIEAFVAEAMQIADVGTFEKREMALLKKREDEKILERTKKPVKKKDERVRVKAKKRS